jgi:hypothetical protein
MSGMARYSNASSSKVAIRSKFPEGLADQMV